MVVAEEGQELEALPTKKKKNDKTWTRCNAENAKLLISSASGTQKGIKAKRMKLGIVTRER